MHTEIPHYKKVNCSKPTQTQTVQGAHSKLEKFKWKNAVL